MALLTGSMQESIILAHFHLHSPISISPETLQFSDFFFSLLKSHCWFLILKTAYNNVAKRGELWNQEVQEVHLGLRSD